MLLPHMLALPAVPSLDSCAVFLYHPVTELGQGGLLEATIFVCMWKFLHKMVLLIQYWFVVLCRGGFFTLKHEVSDISPFVHQLHS